MRYLPIVFFIVFTTIFWHEMKASGVEVEPTLINEPLPAFEAIEIKGMSDILTNGDLATGTYLVNVFGSWCVECISERQVLQTIRPLYGIPLYGISQNDTPSSAMGWLGLHGNPYERIASDTSGSLAQQLGVTSAPETLLVHNGRIRYRHHGPLQEYDMKKTLVKVLRQLEG